MNWNDNLEEGTPAHNLASSTARTIRSVAGPGAGKSFAIQRRIARLMSEGVVPEKILAITFTRTAAKDLRRDISALEVENSDKVVARTLHSHALGILMRADIIEQTNRTPRMILEHEPPEMGSATIFWSTHSSQDLIHSIFLNHSLHPIQITIWHTLFFR
jgi:DNA helicase-2/ATP-dependent DNA helicase PcrA